MSFKDIKGQELSIKALKELIKDERIAGAYLFSGPEGIGKGMVARVLAKAVNCQLNQPDSCDQCPSCVKIDKAIHPDVHVIDVDPSDPIKIESIRQLKREISLRPYEGRKKVFIIDNAHSLTAEAANALLKVLEEPPGDSLIILITSSPALLFRTIVSRCKILKFSSLARPKLQEMLEHDYGVKADTAHLLAYFSDGRLGCALRLKDTDILQGRKEVIENFIFLRSYNAENPRFQKREDARNALNILASWFRDLYLIKTGLRHSELVNIDRKGDLLKMINHYTFTELDEIMRGIADSLMYLGENINVKLLMSNLRISIWKN